jgi:hypothetical protein
MKSLNRKPQPGGMPELSELAQCAKHAYERTQKGRAEFLDGTFELAAALSTARKHFPADRAFASWLNEAGLRTLSKDDRCALIAIGLNVEEAREYFEENGDACSWRLCAKKMRPVSQAEIPAEQQAVEPMRESPTVSLPKAIRAVEALLEAVDSSITTAELASYWQAAADRPSSDQIRKLAQRLNELADALETKTAWAAPRGILN